MTLLGEKATMKTDIFAGCFQKESQKAGRALCSLVASYKNTDSA